jgi:hypothetical protein
VARKVLITGSDQRAEEIAQELRQADVEVLVVEDLALLPGVLQDLPPACLHGYVQLPVTVELQGASVVRRVRDFLEGGLLSRFDTVQAVLPALADDARVLFVAGNTSTVGRDLPDDRGARLALLEVLAHAVRAEGSPAAVAVHVLDQRSATELAQTALGAAAAVRADVADLRRREDDMSYDDWRTEILGMATVEV